jgi:hypothetical protein
LDAKESRYPYHNFRGININDNGLKSSIFFKGGVLLTSAYKYPRQEAKATFNNATLHPEFNDLGRSVKLNSIYLKSSILRSRIL